mgnify:CR=1 FL=1
MANGKVNTAPRTVTKTSRASKTFKDCASSTLSTDFEGSKKEDLQDYLSSSGTVYIKIQILSVLLIPNLITFRILLN